MHQFFSAKWEQEIKISFLYFQGAVHSCSPQSLGDGQAFGVTEGVLYTIELIYEISC